MVIAAIVFLGLFSAGMILMLRHFMQVHVTGAMGHLQKLNDELLRQQSELKQKIAEAEKEYQTKTAKAQQEISTMQAQARQEAAKAAEESRSRAMQEREKIINEAVETREKMRKEIMAEMEDKAIQHSKELLEAFFGGVLRKAVHENLVQEVVDGIQELHTEHFQITTDHAEIISAEALTEDIKGRIQKALKERIKKEVKLKERLDTALVGGVVVKFGPVVIDGSLRNRLEESAVQLKKETARRYQGAT